MYTVDPVVGGHDRPRLARAACEGELEGQEMDLAQRALRHDDRVLGPADGLVVGGVVLDARANAVVLDPRDVLRCQYPGQDRIIGECLKTSTYQRRALDCEKGQGISKRETTQAAAVVI